jgi:hypothetical protein
MRFVAYSCLFEMRSCAGDIHVYCSVCVTIRIELKVTKSSSHSLQCLMLSVERSVVIYGTSALIRSSHTGVHSQRKMPVYSLR